MSKFICYDENKIGCWSFVLNVGIMMDVSVWLRRGLFLKIWFSKCCNFCEKYLGFFKVMKFFFVCLDGFLCMYILCYRFSNSIFLLV